MSAGDIVGDRRREPVADELDDASNVLVLSSALDGAARRTYFESFVPADLSDTRVLAINYTREPEEWLAEWRSHVGRSPATCVIVSVTDGARSRRPPSAPDPGWVARGVEAPDDLTGLGITIGKHFSAWEGEDVLLTFDSLTVLLQYVELQRAFRFLHVMTNRTKSVGALGHYHMDPGAHDDRAIATLSSLFDAIVEFRDGEWTVRLR